MTRASESPARAERGRADGTAPPAVGPTSGLRGAGVRAYTLAPSQD
jgi:hypothetical protein